MVWVWCWRVHHGIVPPSLSKMIYAIGFFIGSLLGLTGAGGSIFAVPLLIIVLGLSPANAMGVALGAVSASALLGTIAQRHHVLWLPAIILAGGGAIFAPIGKYLSLHIADSLLVLGFAVIALLIAVRMLRQSIIQPQSSGHVRASMPASAHQNHFVACRLSPTGQFQLKPRCLSGLIVGGGVIGFSSGLFGVGGGFLIVPMLLFLSSLSMVAAIATSLAAITLISGSGFVAHLWLSEFSSSDLLIKILLGAVAGMLVSQRISRFIAGPILQKIFSILLIVISLMLLAQHFYFSSSSAM